MKFNCIKFNTTTFDGGAWNLLFSLSLHFPVFKLSLDLHFNSPIVVICPCTPSSQVQRKQTATAARWEWEITGTQVEAAWHYAHSRALGIYPEGWSWAWGSGCLGLCVRPFSSTSGPRKTGWREQQHPSPSPNSSSICTAELDGPATMWRIPVRLFLVFICCVRWCQAEGKVDFLSFFFYVFSIFASWTVHWVAECTCCSPTGHLSCRGTWVALLLDRNGSVCYYRREK